MAGSGEVEGLTVSLNAAVGKLVGLDRTTQRRPSSTVDLGIPVIWISGNH